MSTVILKAEVQARIDALTYPVDSTVLLQNAVDTVGLDLDLTNIISVLGSATAAIDTNTPNDDVTALNATSIALGVTSKGGGQKSFRFKTAGGVTLAAGGGILNIPCADNERIVITTFHLSSSSGSSSGVSMSTDKRVIFNQGELRVYGFGASIMTVSNGIAVRGEHPQTTGHLTFGLSESVTITNNSGIGSLYIVWQIQELDE